jgi:UDP-N-acetylmuramate dehydrogenase
VKENIRRLAAALGERVQRDAPLAAHTSMRVGGPADLLMICTTTADLVEAVQMAQTYGVPWLLLGGGCNVLVADAGVRGLVLINRADNVRISPDGTVWAEAGAGMAGLARATVVQGLAGLEWASGLPGTVGGAIVGNAGAFDGDIAGVLRSATLLFPDGTVSEQPAEWFTFTYRGSRLKGTGQPGVILAATFGLHPGDPQRLAARAEEILEWRRTRHPAGATMGSTFKNPPDGHAGYLIEQAGLRGTRIGGAQVSELHGNFFMNTGGATAADVLALIEHVRAEVERQFGVRLELEVELIGEWVHPHPTDKR